MTLKSYLKMKGITPHQFAEAIGFSKGNVLKWVNGNVIRAIIKLQKIVKQTNGKVTANNFKNKYRAVKTVVVNHISFQKEQTL